MSKKKSKYSFFINFLVLVIFLTSLVTYVASNYYKTSSAKKLFDNRQDNREYAIKLSQELHDKAGMIVANSNFDPIMPVTLLRILLRMPEDEIKSYTYNQDLIITTTGVEPIIDIRDIIDYAHVTKNSNQYTISLD